jgi:hypothetical protein
MGTRAQALSAKAPLRSTRKAKPIAASRLERDALHNSVTIAGEKGLLQGRRTLVIRGRMPERLIAEAKRKTGITSDSRLLETALAHIVAADDYADWLFSQRGTVDPALDLEF